MSDALNKNLGVTGAGDYDAWPEAAQKISYPCKADDSLQPAIAYFSPNPNRPMLVGLHTWAGDYTQVAKPYADWCIEHDWNFIYPNFRGPNENPQACGSELAIQDISDAVEFMAKTQKIDSSRTCLCGASGGGHMAMLMAGRRPELWARVSTWCGITNLSKWYYQTKQANRGYYLHIEKICGGEPADGTTYYRECMKRSPVTYLPNAAAVKLDINAGIHDGHAGSVPISHSIEAFNLLAKPQDKITPLQMEIFLSQQRVPSELVEDICDPVYGEKKVLFRRESNNARLTIFEGNHEIVYQPALHWLSRSAHCHIEAQFCKNGIFS